MKRAEKEVISMRSALKRLLVLFTFGLAPLWVAHSQSNKVAKPRVVITADPELDDNDSLIRAILYTTDFDLQGLVYASSGVHWKGDGKGTTQVIPGREYTRLGMCKDGCTSWRWPKGHEELFIDNIVDAYAKAYPNLKLHNAAFPLPEVLKKRILWGSVAFEADYSQDTPGSDLIKKLLLDTVQGPVYVTAQGGQSTIARALKSIYDQYHTSATWADVRDKVSKKLIIIPWGDQDGTYARYIKPNWPDVQNWQLAMIEYGYGVRGNLAPENAKYVSGAWTEANVLKRGPLGALYRVWGDGKVMVEGDPTDYFGLIGFTTEKLRAKGYAPFTPPQEKNSFISEGDTPTFLNLINNGLRADVDGSWGGWGGVRRENAQGRGPSLPSLGPDDPGVAPGLSPSGIPNPNAPGKDGSWPAAPQRQGGFPRRTIAPETAAINARLFAASQDDFAARLLWATTPRYKDANHAPSVSIVGQAQTTAAAGSTVPLQVKVSDPDANTVRTEWWYYQDAGSYRGAVTIADPAAARTTFTVPPNAKSGDTIHMIAEAKDNGTPSLTHYARVVVTVK